MSATDEENEVPRVEKLYCCGNSSQREALYISRVNFAFAVFAVMFQVSFAAIAAGYPSLLQKLPKSGVFIQTLALLDTLNPLSKWAILILAPVYEILKILVAIMLSYGAQQRNCKWLKWWFALTVILTLQDVSLAIYLATVLKSTAVCVGVAICIILYNWYALWICLVLIRRTRGIENGYEVPSDDEYLEVQMEPSPVPVPHSHHHHHHQQHQEDKV